MKFYIAKLPNLTLTGLFRDQDAAKGEDLTRPVHVYMLEDLNADDELNEMLIGKPMSVHDNSIIETLETDDVDQAKLLYAIYK